MDQLTRIVRTYLEEPESSYALMIDGSWGSGKTYYWEHTITRLVANRVAETTGKPMRPAYVSLYGLTSTEQIDAKVFLALHPALNTKTGKLLRTVGRLAIGPLGHVAEEKLGLKLPKLDVKLKEWGRMDDVVLCFDDLERSAMRLNSVLGYLNQFVEHENVKTILLCDEKELRASKKPNYQRLKEKVVGKTTPFVPDHAAVVRSLIGSFSANGKFHRLLKPHEELVLDLFKRSGTDSVRILKRALSVLRPVLLCADQVCRRHTEIHRRLILLTLPLTFEYLAAHGTPEELRQIATGGIGVLYASAFDPKAKPSYANEYANRYLSDHFMSAVQSKAISDLVMAGSWDSEAFVAELREMVAEKSPVDEAIQLLTDNNPLRLDDTDFQRHFGTLWAAVRDGEIANLPHYFRIYTFARLLADKRMIRESREDVIVMLRTAVEKAVSAEKVSYDDDLPENLPLLGDSAPDILAFMEVLLSGNEKLRKAHVKAETSRWLALLGSDAGTAIVELANDLLNVPVLGMANPDVLVRRLVALPNEQKLRFGHAIERRLLKRPSSDQTKAEVSDLVPFKESLATWVSGRTDVPRPPSLVAAEQVLGVLEEAIKKHAT